MITWRGTYRILAGIALLLLVLLAGRMAVGVMATPPSLWPVEFNPLTRATESPAVPAIVANGPDWLSDPAIARGWINGCVSTSLTPAAAASCLEAVDYGLAASPLSAELWLARARLLARQGILDDQMVEALANSYRSGPLESWVASDRLPFALQMLALLPAELTEDIGRDVELVVPNRTSSGPLIAAFIADPFLRQSSWPLISQFTTFDQQEQLIAWIRQAL